MSYFEQSDQGVSQKFGEKSQGGVQEQKRKKVIRHWPLILLLVLVVFILVSAAYVFGPSVEGMLLERKSKVSLTAIIYSENNPMARVNNEVVHEGDMVGDVKVVKIHKDSVDFEKANRSWSQSLPVVKEKGYSVSSSLPELLMLGSDRCPACREMEPILNHLNFEYSKKFKISQIDVWEDREAGDRYDVRAIPTLIFYDGGGKEVFRHVGFYSEADILGTWKELGFKL